MAPTREAVILIPGFFGKSQGDYVDNLLANGLTSRLENRRVDLEGEAVKIAGQTGRQFTLYNADQLEKTVDIYEAYWLDLVENLSEKSLKEQVFRGFYLLLYWGLSHYWMMAQKSKLLVVQFVVIIGLVALWYYGNVAIALTAIGQNPTSFGISLPSTWASTLAHIGDAMGSWSVWVFASIFLGLMPTSVNVLVNILDFSTRYIEDDITATGSIRDRVRLRVKSTLDDVLKQGNYDRITVLAHSMGVAVGIDLLADYYNPTTIPIRFISLGGMVELFSYKVQWITAEIRKCVNNPAIAQWTDYYSKQDWLCTKTPHPDGTSSEKLTHQSIQFRVPLARQLFGDTHVAYFYDAIVLEDVVGLSVPSSSTMQDDSR